MRLASVGVQDVVLSLHTLAKPNLKTFSYREDFLGLARLTRLARIQNRQCTLSK